MKVDMSPQAVKGRLKLVGRLWRLSLELREAKRKTDARKKLTTPKENFKAEMTSIK